MTIRSPRLVALGIMLTVALVALAVLMRAGGTDTATGSPVSGASNLAKAMALAALPPYVGSDPADGDPARRIDGQQIVAAARTAAAETPFPGDADIGWATTFEGGISPEGVVRITEMRAACDWSQQALTAATPGARQEAAEILAQIPRWPAFARSSLGDGPRAVSAAIAKSESTAIEQFVRSC